MATITAFIGVKGSGKDYRSDKLVAAGAVRVDFKDALIKMAEDLIGFPIPPADYEAFKENLVGLTGPGLRNAYRMPLHKITGEILQVAPEAMTGRRLLQRLGTEVMRKRDPEYWADQFSDKAFHLLEDGKDVVCADCRFPNEMETIERVGRVTNSPVFFIFCDYRSPRYDAKDSHPSEALAQGYLRLGCKDGDVLERKLRL